MPPASEPKSVVRALVGVLSLVSSLVVIPIGLTLLVGDMQAGAHTPGTMVSTLGVLGVGGGLLAFGIAMLIWEVSVRYGIRR